MEIARWFERPPFHPTTGEEFSYHGETVRRPGGMAFMICVTIAQTSRRLALADMLNAAAVGADLLEVRLDTFENSPDPRELLTARRKPVIFSCRRPEDGGAWRGSEAERIRLLKTAIINDADYCELELDIADEVRRFGACQRVISYTNLKETPSDIADVYEEMRTKQPDVIKLTCRARTPEEAWPLLQLLVKPPVPTVVVGLGRPGVMLPVLGRKIGAPWTVAALEKGMEAYPGQPTMRDLDLVYHYRSIDRQTRLVGVTGVGEREYLTTAMLNACFAHLNLTVRCLPLQVGSVRQFGKVIDALKVLGVVIEEDQQDALRPLAASVDPDVEGVILNPGGAPAEHRLDLLVADDDKQWRGAHTFGVAAVQALERRLAEHDRALDGTIVLVVGLGGPARSLARHLKERQARLIFASRSREAAARFCRVFGGRQIPIEAIYATLHDVAVLCRDEGEDSAADAALHPGFLKPGLTVMDLTSIPRKSALLREAEGRNCAVVPPAELLLDQVRAQLKRLVGVDAPRSVLEQTLGELLDEE